MSTEPAVDDIDEMLAPPTLEPLDVRPSAPVADPRPAALRRAGSHWRTAYGATLICADAAALLVAAVLARVVSAGSRDVAAGITIAVLLGGIVLALAAAGAYEVRALSSPLEELRRVGRALLAVWGAIALVVVISQSVSGRGFVVAGVPLALGTVLLGRFGVRLLASRRRRTGHWVERVLAVGPSDQVNELVAMLARHRNSGLQVVGACLKAGDDPQPVDVPVLGVWGDAARAADAVHADVVAVVGSGHGPRALRELTWTMERTCRPVVTALELSDVAHSRISIRPVDGVPLAWVQPAKFTGTRAVVKRAMDLAAAGLGLLVCSPFMLLIALAIRTTSRGPAIFKQWRQGKDGELIRVWKFRTMVDGAERQRPLLDEHNEGADLLFFKIRNDPRITPVGRLLRRASLDELPQLVNVLLGSMSLVGPRPLPGEIANGHVDFRRRLLVKPGLTGLWQVSGRSDLSLEDSLRLDLYYVENWSVGLDLAIILRTAWAVLRSRGAY